jgi:hypothetical protein
MNFHIPHKLGRTEASRRIEARISEIKTHRKGDGMTGCGALARTRGVEREPPLFGYKA